MNEHFKTFSQHVEEEHKLITEVAAWDNAYKRYLDRGTVSCDEAEKYERIPIRNAVKKMYPSRFTTAQIDAAIDSCCQTEGQSRQREDFKRCVLNHLLATVK